MEDIIATIPWACDDKDCAYAWHKGNYWAYDDGTYSFDGYADGDHEGVDAEDVPTPEAVAKSWRDYASFVKQTGREPLGEYFVKKSRKTSSVWQVRFSPSILGAVFAGARRNSRGPWLRGDEIPKAVYEYLNLTKTPGASQNYVFADDGPQSGWRFSSFAKIVNQDKNVTIQRSPDRTSLQFLVRVEQDVPLPASTVSRQLRVMANKNL